MDHKVGTESQRTHQDKIDSGFYKKYMNGIGLDIGFAGYTEGVVPILPNCIGVDKDYPGYDGKTLPFADQSQDYVYSSHCLEHIEDYVKAWQEWHRVVKVGGFIVVVVPHQYLYEKQRYKPSRGNQDHKRFYTPGRILREVEDSLVPNTYRVRLLEDGDKGFNYELGPEVHSDGQYEITLVVERIMPPHWQIG